MVQSDNTDLIIVLKQIANGDEQAVRVFYRNYYNNFIKFGRLITDDLYHVEDAIQNLLIWIIENPIKVETLNRPDVYIYRSLRNNLLHGLQQSRRTSSVEIEDVFSEILITASVETQWIEEENIAIQNKHLRYEIAQLPDYLQQTLYLRYFSNMEYDDIASIMDVKSTVARIYIHRAIERLRKILRKP